MTTKKTISSLAASALALGLLAAGTAPVVPAAHAATVAQHSDRRAILSWPTPLIQRTVSQGHLSQLAIVEMVHLNNTVAHASAYMHFPAPLSVHPFLLGLGTLHRGNHTFAYVVDVPARAHAGDYVGEVSIFGRGRGRIGALAYVVIHVRSSRPALPVVQWSPASYNTPVHVIQGTTATRTVVFSSRSGLYDVQIHPTNVTGQGISLAVSSPTKISYLSVGKPIAVHYSISAASNAPAMQSGFYLTVYARTNPSATLNAFHYSFHGSLQVVSSVTATPSATMTATTQPTNTSTATPTATLTPTNTVPPTATSTITPTATSTMTPTATLTATSTNTPLPTNTFTATPTATHTSVPTATATSTATH